MTFPDKTFVKEDEAMALLGFTENQWRNLRDTKAAEDAAAGRLPEQRFAAILPGYKRAHFRVSQLRDLKARLDGATQPTAVAK